MRRNADGYSQLLILYDIIFFFIRVFTAKESFLNRDSSFCLCVSFVTEKRSQRIIQYTHIYISVCIYLEYKDNNPSHRRRMLPQPGRVCSPRNHLVAPRRRLIKKKRREKKKLKYIKDKEG